MNAQSPKPKAESLVIDARRFTPPDTVNVHQVHADNHEADEVDPERDPEAAGRRGGVVDVESGAGAPGRGGKERRIQACRGGCEDAEDVGRRRDEGAPGGGERDWRAAPPA